MAKMKYHGLDIAGGGLSVVQMTRAQYEANKTALDASDLLIEITDDVDAVATAEQIVYGNTNVEDALDAINADLTANTFGNYVDLLSYSNSNPYTAPHDGYVYYAVDANGAQGFIRVSDTSASILHGVTSGRIYESNALYVKKGMKLSVSDVSANFRAYYRPIT